MVKSSSSSIILGCSNKGVMEASVLLSVSVFTVTFILFFHGNTEAATSDVYINCGSKWNSTALDGREWIGESASASISGQSTSSVVVATSFIGADPVPYITSRISSSPFHFTFHVSPGQKFIRLHFYPSLYHGFEMSLDLFTVKAGPFILLGDYSPTHSSGSKFIVKEFCLNVEQHGKLRITFSPSKSHMSYAFVNGIEIVSMPTGLYYTPDGDAGASVVGQNNRFYGIDNRTALGMVQRLNIGGSFISSVEDVSIFRRWNADASYFQESRACIMDYRAPQLQVYTKITLLFVAPPKLFQTSWKTKTHQLNSFTWKIPITVGFRYLVRLHFSDHDAAMADGERKEFSILIDNQIAEMRADVMRWSGGTGFPVYKDYVVTIKGDEEGSEYDLFIVLQSLNGLSLGLLKGIELFRLSNLQNSLASSSSSHAVLKKVSTNWSLNVQGRFLSLFSQRNVTGTCILVIILIVTITIYYLRMSREKNSQNFSNSNRRFSLVDIRSATQNFSDEFVIGRGGFGNVYRGILNGFPDTVAIKRLSPLSRQGDGEFWAEIETLSNLRHLNLVSLIGYCDEDEEKILVYEYISGGTLDENLFKYARKGKEYTLLSWEARLGICIGVARGLEYLHTGSETGIIHRDVKGSNILLDEKLVAKISDFGLSKLEESESMSTNIKGTRGYLDPHYRCTRRLTKKSDVYSFGIVMLVVLSGRPALDSANPRELSLLACFQECLSREEFDSMVDANIRNSISAASLKQFVKCVEKCLQQDPKNRPTMAQLVATLEQALQPPQENQKPESVERLTQGSVAVATKVAQIVHMMQIANRRRGVDGTPFSIFPWNIGPISHTTTPLSLIQLPNHTGKAKQQHLALVMHNQSNGGCLWRPWRITPKVSWERLLPADYRDILSRSPEGLDLLHSSMPKKELCHHLCNNILLIDNGTKSFTIDKATGKKHLMLSARALLIAWSDTPNYWKFIPLAKSRFNLVAELGAVCWLEIQGVINSRMMSPNTNYTANLVFGVTSKFNWASYSPAEVSVGFSGQECQKQLVHLDPGGDGVLRSHEHTRTVKPRSDGWLEIELGEIHIKEGDEADVVVRLAEVKRSVWKSGLVIEGIDIRAKVE